MTLGHKFKQLRLEKGLKQQELIDDFNKQSGYNFSRTLISQYELNKRRPSPEILKAFASYFNVSVGYLVGSENKDSSSKSFEEVSLETKFMTDANIFFKDKDISREEKDNMFKILSKLYFDSLK